MNNFNKITLPIVKKVYTKTISTSFVPVQPMSAPKGQLFYMDPRNSDEIRYDEMMDRFSAGLMF